MLLPDRVPRETGGAMESEIPSPRPRRASSAISAIRRPSTARPTAGRRRPGQRWRRPGCRSPGCRTTWAAPAPSSPTASPCCARRAASRRRCRWPRRCSPAGCSRRPASPSPRGAMTCGPTRDGDQLTLAARRHAQRAPARRALRQGGQAPGACWRGARPVARRSRWSKPSQPRIADGTSIAGDALNAVTSTACGPSP